MELIKIPNEYTALFGCGRCRTKKDKRPRREGVEKEP